MFEREIQFIYDFNQNKVSKLGSFITYDQLKNSEVHPAILQYISGEIDYLIFEDRQKLLKESLFDYSGEVISEHFAAISGEIKRTKRFSQNYVEKLILHAASFTVNYLARPKWSLLKFIFDEEKSKSALEIKQIFNYFYYYPYLRKIILSYIDKKKVISITFEDFRNLLEKIDNLGLESNHMKIIDEALESMGEFLNVGMTKRRLLPLKAVQNFLAEKSLNQFLVKLEKDFTNPEINRYELNEIKNSLNEVVFEIERHTEEKEIINTADEEPDSVIDTFDSDKAIDEEPVETDEIEISEQDEDNIEVTESEPVIPVTNTGIISGQDDLGDIDITEDSRIDGEGIHDLVEVIKEEKVELEIEHLQNENVDIHSAESIEDDEEDDELDFDKNDPHNSAASDEDNAMRLYLEEMQEISEGAKESDQETSITESDLLEFHEEYEEETLDKDEVLEQPEDEEIDDETDEFINENHGSNWISENEKYDETDVSDEDKDLDEAEEKEYSSESLKKNFDSEEDLLKVLKNYEPKEDVESDTYTDDDEDTLEIEKIAETNESLLEDDTVAEDEESEESLEDEPEENEVEDDEAIDNDVFDKIDSLSNDSDVSNILNELEDQEEDEDLDLFGKSDFIDNEKIMEEEANSDQIDETISKSDTPRIDMSELLENKKMNKIIDTIFDYDMEDFANAMEKVGEAVDKEDALRIVDEICSTAQVNPSSKEAKTFKSIIADYFNQK